MRKLAVFAVVCAALPFAALSARGQAPAQSQEKPESSSQAPPAATAAKPVPPPPAPKLKGAAATQPVDPNAGKTIEEIIARVNNEIITLTEYQKARETASEDAKQECQGRCTAEQLQTDIEERQKNALRDLIDQSLLVQRAKDMGISVKPEV